MSQTQQIRDRLAKATAGPWEWRTTDEPMLVAPHHGLLYVMGFRRRGMQGGQPTFAEREGNNGGLMRTADQWGNLYDSPDADLIASAPEDIAYLLGIVDKLPVTADGVVVLPGLDDVYRIDRRGFTDHWAVEWDDQDEERVYPYVTAKDVPTWHSTEEAARKAFEAAQE